MCKEKRTVATVPLLIRSNYSRAKRSIRTASNFSTTTVGRAFNNVRQGENVRDGIKRFENQTERRTEVSVLVRFIFLFHFTLRLFWKKDKGGNGREDNAAWMSGRVSEPIPSRACFPGSWTRRKEKEKRQRGRNGDESRRKNSLAWDRDEDEQEMPKEAEEQEEEETLHNRRKAHRATEEHTHTHTHTHRGVYIRIYTCTRSKRRVDSRSFRPLAKQTAPCPMQHCVSWFLHRSARSTLHLRTDSLTRCHWFESSAPLFFPLCLYADADHDATRGR